MTVFEMVVIIAVTAMVVGLLRTFIRHRAAGSGLSADQEARLGKLEERVRSLEAVVGDSSFELKQKFRELEK